jgi:hypothetical protein
VKPAATQPSDAAKLNLLGRTLAAFSLACIFGLITGLWIKPNLLAVQEARLSIKMAGQTKANTMIRYLVLRKKLELIDANKAEIDDLFSRIEPNELDDAIANLDRAISVLNPQSEIAHSRPKPLPHLIEAQP